MKIRFFRNFYLTFLLVALLVYRTNPQSFNSTVAQYLFTPVAMNIAYTGTDPYTNTFFSYRSLQQTIEGAPMFLSISGDSPLSKNGAGVGGVITYQTPGYINMIRFRGSYSYKLQLSEKQLIAFGLGLGGFSSKLATAKLDLTEVEGLQDYADEPFTMEGSAGVLYRNEKFEVGASIPAVSKNRAVSILALSTPNFILNSNYIIQKGIHKIVPSLAVMQYSGYQTQASIGCTYTYLKAFTLFGLFNTGNKTLNWGFKFNYKRKIDLMMSYANSMGGSATVLGNSIEFGMGYKLMSDEVRKELENKDFDEEKSLIKEKDPIKALEMQIEQERKKLEALEKEEQASKSKNDSSSILMDEETTKEKEKTNKIIAELENLIKTEKERTQDIKPQNKSIEPVIEKPIEKTVVEKPKKEENTVADLERMIEEEKAKLQKHSTDSKSTMPLSTKKETEAIKVIETNKKEEVAKDTDSQSKAKDEKTQEEKPKDTKPTAEEDQEFEEEPTEEEETVEDDE